MKILLDENLPRQLKFSLGTGHELFTIREMSWHGKRNGELLELMTQAGFDAFVTMDKNLRHQQNMNRFPVSLFVLNAPNSRLDTLEPYIEKLSECLDSRLADQIVIIDLE